MTESPSVRAVTKHVDVGDANLAWREFGHSDGTPLVMLHRFRATMDHWDPDLLDALAQGRRIVLLDSAGVGFSSGHVPETIAGMADVVARFMKALGIDRADLLGWSMGGAVALSLALNYPAVVRRLILAGTGPGGVPESPRAPDKVWQVAGKPKNSDDDFLYLFFTDSTASRDAGLASLRRLDRRLVKSAAVVSSEGVRRQAAAIAAWGQGQGSAFARLGEINVPVFVANGSHDIMVHAYNSYIMSQRLSNASLTLYPDSGHGFLFQYPHRFARDVLEFLGADHADPVGGLS